MASYKHIVAHAGKTVQLCNLADTLDPIWSTIEWEAHVEPGPGIASVNPDGNSIRLYPGLFEQPSPHLLVLTEFGRLILKKAGDKGASIWSKKLDIPRTEAIDLAASKLKDDAVRALSSRYVDVLGNYPDKGHSVDRLVFIHIANALLANNIAYADSVGVDIRTWGPTYEYCAGKKYHSLIPLVSAYAPSPVHNDFGVAVQHAVTSNLREVRDSSVAYALAEMIRRITKLASN